MIVALGGHYRAAEADLDLVVGLDLRDEVHRHGVLEPGAADDHDHPFRVAGEVQRGLGRRVGAADDVYVVALALAGLAGGRAVVDAAAGEVLQAGSLEPPVGDAAGDDDGTRLQVPEPSKLTARTGPLVSSPTTSRASSICAPKRVA